MKERGIYYSAHSILAKKKRLKTVTRRPIKGLPDIDINDIYPEETKDFSAQSGRWAVEYLKDGNKPWVHSFVNCPYGVPGDRLWTKENYRVSTERPGSKTVSGLYLADECGFGVQLSDSEWEKFRKRKYPARKTPGRFMYRSLSRFLDEITAIEVERVQDITEIDACSEGVKLDFDIKKDRSGREQRIVHHYWDYIADSWKHALNMEYAARLSFKTLWDSMYAGTEFAWANNPWVWVIRQTPLDPVKQAMKDQLENTSIL